MEPSVTEDLQSIATDPPQNSTDETPTDPYKYLQSGQFTSEKYKIEVFNLPRQCRKHCYAELKRRLTSTLQLNPHKIKALQNSPFAFVTFRCEEDRDKALEKINGHAWKECFLAAKKAQPSADPLMKKRKQKEEGNETIAKKQKQDIPDDTPPEIRLKNSVTPLWNVPYEEQLEIKIEDSKDLLNFLVRQKETKDFFCRERKIYNGLCCELYPIKPSPVLLGYRNKSEFTIGKNLDGTESIIGFRYGLYRDGTKCVGKPDIIEIIPDKTKNVVKSFQDYVAQSPLEVFDPESHEGHWHQLTVRTTLGRDIMAVIEFHPQQLTVEAVGEVKTSLAEYFSEGSGRTANITSLYFRQTRARSVKELESIPYEHLHGETHIFEDLLGMKFQISPDAFFQVNTIAAEVLYNQIIEWCDINPNTVVLDICCGTGTIGLAVAKKASKVIGIEMCSDAVRDAKANAQLNGITNVEYHCGKAEDIINEVMKKTYLKDVVAIVDPPRPGLHKNVIKALRACQQLKRIVYASCSPKSVKPNFSDLIRRESKRLHGASFVPIKAIPVDLFPQTKHCELVVLFQRLHDRSNPKHDPEEKSQAEVNDVQQTEKVEENLVDKSYNSKQECDTVDVTSKNTSVAISNNNLCHGETDDVNMKIDEDLDDH